ncbi:MAG: sulfite exporter TauE/SafE family protein [Alphaproteobacteria bacterium]|nr:sulfite exporter TauE/SafE family protein [Alphaproteobacteria bacterium]NNF24573.1 sulfite exporter TauE/SafE family protein [Paracoccaceae bacterium]
MIAFDLTFFAVAGFAVLFAGISKGGFGSGAAFLATPILALIVEPGLALGLMLPLLMLADAVALPPYWKLWDWPASRLLIVGSLPGVALGAALYTVANADMLRLLIGAMALAFVAYQLTVARWQNPGGRHFGPQVGLGAGAVAGFTSFISHAGGPPVAMYLLARGASKTGYQATTVLVFWAINIFKFVPYAFLGVFTADTLHANLMLIPFALAGVAIGVRAHHVVPERIFFAITYVLLAATGAKLVWDALS